MEKNKNIDPRRLAEQEWADQRAIQQSTIQQPIDQQRLAAIALTGRILGALYSQPPDSAEVAPLVTLLRQGDWLAQWPVSDDRLPAIAVALRVAASVPAADQPDTPPEALTDAWQRLFVGPWALPAPPWGSVWLDKDGVLFGESMVQLRQWLRGQGISWANSDTEPCDHIGALLLLAAWLAEQGRGQALDQLLAWHLLPWAYRFLEVFTAKAEHPFFSALGKLCWITLQHWQAALIIPVAQKQLYL